MFLQMFQILNGETWLYNNYVSRISIGAAKKLIKVRTCGWTDNAKTETLKDFTQGCKNTKNTKDNSTKSEGQLKQSEGNLKKNEGHLKQSVGHLKTAKEI